MSRSRLPARIARVAPEGENGRMTSAHSPEPDAPAPEPATLTAAQIVAHARFSEPGLDKSSAKIGRAHV